MQLLIEIARNTDSLAAIKLAGKTYAKSEKQATLPAPTNRVERLEILRYDWIAAKILKQIGEDLTDQPTKKKGAEAKPKRKR